MSRTLVIATRESPLALWQSNFVKSEIQALKPDWRIELLGMTTTGDRFLEQPLSELGGKGLFVKELEKALIEHQADLAVHSMKDMPMLLPEGLALAAILKRGNPWDALVSHRYKSLSDLPQNAVVGTSSLRRQAQLLWLRPDFQIKNLRGNVQTRLKKLEQGEYDAIILASAGLERLGLFSSITEVLTLDQMCPATGQGAIGIECRAEDATLRALLDQLNDRWTYWAVMAERALNEALGGSCHFPIASFAKCDEYNLQMIARVGAKDGSALLESCETILFKSSAPILEQVVSLGLAMAHTLKSQGADALIHG
jgi:hydroxymethylbilane synthase